MNTSLAKKINKMAVKDQKMRQKVEAGGTWDYSVDQKNTECLKKIINKHGWPTVALVGKRASKGAWLIAQHADHDVNFQEYVLCLLKTEFGKNPKSIDKTNIAYLTDRILLKKNRKQKFGTQFYINKDGVLKLKPTLDPINLNKRRAEYGLDDIEKYLEDAKNYVAPQNKK